MTAEEVEYDSATVTLQIQQFMDEWHYRIIATLAGSWDRYQATIAALSLFEMQGVAFEPGEKEALAKLEEPTMIQKLLTKMPHEFMVQFEHFALQLQLIITTATRVRKVVEEGQPEAIQQVMDHTDSSGIISQILKQAIVQAGTEVSEIRNRHTSWTKNTEHRMTRLVRSVDECQAAQRQLQALQAGTEVSEIRNRHTSWTKNTEHRMTRLVRSVDECQAAQRQLQALQAQIDGFGSNQNEKSKKMMAGVASNNDKALSAMIFSTWFTFTAKMKGEKDIRDMFEAEIENLDAKLMEYRQAALTNVRNVLMRKAAEGDSALIQQTWKAWTDEVQETKREAGSQGAMAAMEKKLAESSAAQTENTKKVMARMSAGSDNAILQLTLTAWKQFLEDYKKNKDQEDAIKAQEKAMEEFMKQKKDGAKQVLDKMNSATDSGLVEHVMSSWAQNYKENKEARKMEELMAENEARFGALNGRQKDNAKGVMSRVNEQMELNCLLKHFCAWATDTKLERIMRHYNSKMEGKKQQLQSVQHLFKSFATQLDQGLKGDGDSARDSSSRRKSKDDFQLPDIQKK